MQQTLNLRPFIFDVYCDPVPYTMHAGILHKGSNTNEIEYVSYVKADNKWRCLNDGSVKPPITKPV